MSPFFSQIYTLVASIPPGQVMTYGQIATALGRPRAAKAVGTAMRLSPAVLSLPCHRVVNQRGTLAPPDVFGAQALQRELLRAEGVPFLPNGCIDLSRCVYSPTHLPEFFPEGGPSC